MSSTRRDPRHAIEAERFVLGLDTGNTKTIAIAAQANGTILGWGRSGCGDIYGAGVEPALDAMQAAVRGALAQAGLQRDDLSEVVISAAGADWPEDFVTIRDGAILRGIGNAERPPIVYNDAIGGLRAGSPDGTGVAVVCGTGAAIGARSPDGRIWHSSFWQGPQGGHALARAAFDAVVRAELGTGPSTALTDAILAHLGAPSVEDALHMCTARDRPHPPMTPLVRILFDAADRGDALACHLIDGHGRSLGDYALVAARKVGIDLGAFFLVLTGGVMRHPSALLRHAIAVRVREASPDAVVIADAMEPAIGATMLAIQPGPAEIPPDVRERLRATMPDAAAFDT
jgi:N-acetylglucosamine kinase-like BadF-type ATPase